MVTSGFAISVCARDGEFGFGRLKPAILTGDGKADDGALGMGAERAPEVEGKFDWIFMAPL